MAFKIPKQYGSYKTDNCVFCGSPSYGKNEIGLPVCKVHKNTDHGPDFKCTCGEYIDVLVGKYGAYAKCIRCGNKKLAQIMEFNAGRPQSTPSKTNTPKPAETKKLSKDEYEYGLILD